MAYKLKTTGIAASCVMLVAVDPDTNTVKDFADATRNSELLVGANVTTASQSWKGVSRPYFRDGAGTADADFVKFGATKYHWDFTSDGQEISLVAIYEMAAAQGRVIGSGSTHCFAGVSLAAGGATHPQIVGIGFTSQTGGGAAPTSGQKRIYGFSAKRHTAGAGGSTNIYYGLESDSALTKVPVGVATASGAAHIFDVEYIGRNTSSTTHNQDKRHLVAIFNRVLTDAEWQFLLDDWSGTLLEVEAGGGAPTINTQPSNQTVIAPATATFSVAATASGGALSYQWQREPAAGGGFTNIGSATSSTYTSGATSVTGGSHNNGDKYRCAVTDSNGTTNSSAATLTVSASDVTAPVLTSPTGAQTGSTTASGGVTTDEGGTAYAVVSTSATKPSTAQMRLGQTHAGVAAPYAITDEVLAGALTFDATGLTPATVYYWHFMVEDATPNPSTVATSASFTTASSTLAGFDLHTATGLVFGDLAGALTSLARQAAVDVVARAYNTSTGALVATSGTLTTNSVGRLARWTHASLTAATQYVLTFTRVSDGEVCSTRMTAT